MLDLSLLDKIRPTAKDNMRSQGNDLQKRYVELQHWVIGVTLADPENHARALVNIVHPKAIQEPSLKPISAAIKQILEDGGNPPTGSDIALWLQNNDAEGYKAVGGDEGIAHLVDMGEEAIVEHNNISIIHETLNAAAFHSAMQDFSSHFYNTVESVPYSELQKYAENAIQGLQDLRVSYSSNVDDYTHTAAEIMEQLSKELDDIKNGEKQLGIPLRNFPRLSKYIGGLQPGNLTVVAARPAIGKTTFCCNIIAPLCEAGLSVQFFSIEMGSTEIMKNILSCRYGIPRPDFHKEEGLTPQMQEVFDAAKPKISHWKFRTVEKSGINVAEISQKAKELAESEDGLDVIVVDYIQIVKPDKDNGTTQDNLAYVTYQLKFLAMELGVPVVATCQLARPTTNEREMPPTASSIRGSDAIFQAANHLFALHRDREEMPDTTDMLILKNRSGPADITIPVDTALNICFFAEDMNEILAAQRREDIANPAAIEPSMSYSINDY